MPGDKDTATPAEGTPAPAAAAEPNAEQTTKAKPPATDDKKAEEKVEEGKGEGEKVEEKAEEKVEEEKVEEEKVEEEKEEDAKMKCVVLAGFGGSRMMRMVLKPLPPSPTEGQLLIRISTCGMSFQDLLLRQGITDHPPKTPLIMGSECGGVVEAVGPNTTGFNVGDRVIALTDFKAWAELVTVPANQVYKLPESVSFENGVCLLVHYVTAYILLFDIASLRRGQTLLLHSAAGGVGQAILQLAATIGDVTILGTASAHKHDSIRDKVTHLFPHNVDYVREIRKVSPEGLDVVLDCLCGEDTNRGIGLLKPLGKYVLYGSANIVTGETKSFFSFAKSWWQVDKVSPHRLCDENRSIGGFHLRHLLFQQGQHAYVRSVVDKLLELHAQGKITPVIDSVWAFEDVGEGMQRLQDRKNIGKVLLDPSKEPILKQHSDSKADVVEAGEAVAESKEGEGSQKTDDAEEKSEKSDQTAGSGGSEQETEEKKDQKAEPSETPAADAQ